MRHEFGLVMFFFWIDDGLHSFSVEYIYHHHHYIYIHTYLPVLFFICNMIRTLLLVISSLTLCCCLASASTVLRTEERVGAFHEWIDHHGKAYDSDQDLQQRMMIWLENDGTFPVLSFMYIHMSFICI